MWWRLIFQIGGIFHLAIASIARLERAGATNGRIGDSVLLYVLIGA
jgi:hypothetical protein